MFAKLFAKFRLFPFQPPTPSVEPEEIVDSSINPAYTNMVFGNYNPKLIGNLINDHRNVAQHYDNIALAIDNNDWFDANVELIKLMELIREHKRVEFTYLYARLEYTYKTKSQEHDMINFIRKEMKRSTTCFLDFTDHYIDISENP